MATLRSLVRRCRWMLWLGLAPGVALCAAAEITPPKKTPCNRTIVADVVALDQPFSLNRLGAAQPGGMIFALAGDVVPCDATTGGNLVAGKVMLRAGKRPRPLVLRMNVGDCLHINFTNLLAPTPVNGSAPTRFAGLHINGLDLAPSGGGEQGIDSDASWVGTNPGATGSLVAPGGTKIYTYFARAEGTFLLYSAADDANGSDSSSQASMGLFGAVNVQPEWAEWYRSQVTHDDLVEATLRLPMSGGAIPAVAIAPGTAAAPSVDARGVGTRFMEVRPAEGATQEVPAAGLSTTQAVALRDRAGSQRMARSRLISVIPDKHAHIVTSVLRDPLGRLYSPEGHPLIDYNAVYRDGPRAGLPVLKMLQTVKGQPLFETDLTPADVAEAHVGLVSANSYITKPLAAQFATKAQIQLGDAVRITDAEGREAWVLTDPHKVDGLFLVELIRAPVVHFAVSRATLKIVHSDLTAMITGPRAERFGFDLQSPTFLTNPTLPDRRQPYREFTIIYHAAQSAVQAFPQFTNPSTQDAFSPGQDQFAINYGTGAIGAEIIANRIGVGPMGNADAVDLKYEEFFLSSWAVGDPAMVVDVPANATKKAAGGGPGSKPVVTADATPALLAALAAGQVEAALKDQLKAAGVALSDAASVATICAGKEWIVLDPGQGNTPGHPGRGRYPVIARTAIKAGMPAEVVDVFPGPLAAPAVPTGATLARYPDDPSNVYHSNIRDHVKFRILHAGPGPSHVHHLHAHQWLHSPNSTDSQYLDSQLIVPGSAYTLDIVYNGSGNRNMTVGDAIFHCHFYPHFAKGMWSLWRVHDVFEGGTRLDAEGRPVAWHDDQDRPVYPVSKDGQTQFFAYDAAKMPVFVPQEQVHRAFNRALPDGEIALGTPIPAIVPLPTLAEAPMPAPVRLTDLSPFYPEGEGQGRRVYVEPKNAGAIKAALDKKDPPPAPVYENPGYPFFIPGVAGHRSPHPPMDFAWREDPKTGNAIYDKDNKKILLDGGLPRHVALGGQIVSDYQTRFDFTRDFIAYDKDKKPIAGKLSALHLPEDGTPVEKGAMNAHSHRTIPSFLPNGDPGNVTRNGLPGLPGAPYAPPMVDDYGNANYNTRRYQAAVIQTDVVQNKLGWHYPQQRFLTLWEDVAHTIDRERAPQPLFFRSNTDDTIEFWHTNLVPSYYEVDDFQVRTPTDVIGQHIHNVKFDVTSSDGAGNGFNYEDGTFGPNEVRDRINAVNRPGGTGGFGPGLLPFDPRTGFVDACGTPETLTIVPVKDAYPKRDGAGDDKYGLFGKPPDDQDWDGAQTTIQLWDCDPLLSNSGSERTLRTIFTHDHFGPSTHQQAGLYAGLVVEPESSLWYLPSGQRMNSRIDGGPTSWEGYIVPSDPAKSYREFAIEFQDTQLAYTNTSRSTVSNAMFTPAGNPTTGPAAFDVADYQQQTPNQLPAFIAILDRAQLPDIFPTIFAQMGIPLSPQATVSVTAKGTNWKIQEPTPPGVLNSGKSYALWAAFKTVTVDGVKVQIPSSIFVGTPEIPPGWVDTSHALNPPGALVSGKLNAPFPQLVSNGRVGTYSMNYRSESVITRVEPPTGPAGPILKDATDLAYVFTSIERNTPALNVQPTPNSPIDPAQPNGFKFPAYLVQPSALPGQPVAPGGVEPTDPFTPLMRAYAGDAVEVRVLVGAHTLAHSFQIQGVRWNFEPGYADSGYKNAQAMGISEHFEMLFKLPSAGVPHGGGLLPFADYLVSPSSTPEGLANGDWALMRAFNQGVTAERTKLAPLPNNPVESLARDRAVLGHKLRAVRNHFAGLGGPAPASGNHRVLNITATTVFQALPEKKLAFNPAPLYQLDNLLLFVRDEDLDAYGHLKPGAPREPLIARVAAGDWVLINLRNAIKDDPNDPAFSPQSLTQGTPYSGNPLKSTPFNVTRRVGLHPALVAYDVTGNNGVNIGFNPDTTVPPGQVKSFLWYAGDLTVEDHEVKETPIEFGATCLIPADMMVQPQFGMVGALIVEPAGSTWVEDLGTHAAALVLPGEEGAKPFREFVLVGQNIVANSGSVPNQPDTWGAFNFRTETFSSRGLGTVDSTFGFARGFANAQLTPPRDPVTPVFLAAAGTPARFRFVMPSTSTVTSAPFVFDLHGHGWQEEPYTVHGTKIGHNPRSQYFGAQQVAPYEAFNIVLDHSGGRFGVPGDYLYETYQQAAGIGTWGLFRVGPDLVVITAARQVGGILTLAGYHQPAEGKSVGPATIQVSPSPDGSELLRDGRTWTFSTPFAEGQSATFTIRSSLGGEATVRLPLQPSLAPAK